MTKKKQNLYFQILSATSLFINYLLTLVYLSREKDEKWMRNLYTNAKKTTVFL
jgi:hypothetical protein